MGMFYVYWTCPPLFKVATYMVKYGNAQEGSAVIRSFIYDMHSNWDVVLLSWWCTVRPRFPFVWIIVPYPNPVWITSNVDYASLELSVKHRRTVKARDHSSWTRRESTFLPVGSVRMYPHPNCKDNAPMHLKCQRVAFCIHTLLRNNPVHIMAAKSLQSNSRDWLNPKPAPRIPLQRANAGTDVHKPAINTAPAQY